MHPHIHLLTTRVSRLQGRSKWFYFHQLHSTNWMRLLSRALSAVARIDLSFPESCKPSEKIKQAENFRSRTLRETALWRQISMIAISKKKPWLNEGISVLFFWIRTDLRMRKAAVLPILSRQDNALPSMVPLVTHLQNNDLCSSHSSQQSLEEMQRE